MIQQAHELGQIDIRNTFVTTDQQHVLVIAGQGPGREIGRIGENLGIIGQRVDQHILGVHEEYVPDGPEMVLARHPLLQLPPGDIVPVSVASGNTQTLPHDDACVLIAPHHLAGGLAAGPLLHQNISQVVSVVVEMLRQFLSLRRRPRLT